MKIQVRSAIRFLAVPRLQMARMKRYVHLSTPFFNCGAIHRINSDVSNNAAINEIATRNASRHVVLVREGSRAVGRASSVGRVECERVDCVTR